MELLNIEDFISESVKSDYLENINTKVIEDVANIKEWQIDFLRFENSISEGAKEEYEKYFKDMLKKYGVESPAEIKDVETKKKFFNEIKAGWDADAGKPRE